jgi:hypothetical protein
VAGLSSIDHHQRLVEAGYRVGALDRERSALVLDVEHRRVRVANLASPARLLAEVRAREIALDYPVHWNVVDSAEAAARLVAPKAPPPGSAPAASPPRRGTKAAARAPAPRRRSR